MYQDFRTRHLVDRRDLRWSVSRQLLSAPSALGLSGYVFNGSLRPRVYFEARF